MADPQQVEHQVRKALHENESTAGLELSVKFIAGVVFLDGAVPTAVAREGAAEVAGKVEGVRLVHNRVQVIPEHHTVREQLREGEGR